jgi:hypothetical protein
VVPRGNVDVRCRAGPIFEPGPGGVGCRWGIEPVNSHVFVWFGHDCGFVLMVEGSPTCCVLRHREFLEYFERLGLRLYRSVKVSIM